VIGGILRSITDYADVPRLDEQVRQRLVRRFGDGVQSWLEELPGRLFVLRERWSPELDAVIPRGSMSVVIRCRTTQSQRAVLKISPDRERLVNETAGLAHWSTTHVPTVLRADVSTGALLMLSVPVPQPRSSPRPGTSAFGPSMSSMRSAGGVRRSQIRRPTM